MIRVVLDTNILISGLLSPHGLPAEILLMTLEGAEVQLCVSEEIFAEYGEVMSRPRFKRSSEEIASIMGAIRRVGFWVKPLDLVDACSDPDDDIFLECALAAEADYVVTGNIKHFPDVWGSVRVVSSRRFIELTT